VINSLDAELNAFGSFQLEILLRGSQRTWHEGFGPACLCRVENSQLADGKTRVLYPPRWEAVTIAAITVLLRDCA
jgi:hypothetical protein